MKWNDLTKEQQDFLLELDREYPMPDGATHFDVRDRFDTSWMQLDEESGVYLTATNGREYCAVEDVEALRDFISIPDKPWYDPKDVSLNKPVSNGPSGSSNSYYWIEIPRDRVKIDEENGVVGFMSNAIMSEALDQDSKHNHYFKVWHGKLDIYRILRLWDCKDPCIQHAVKKLLCAGGRGHKDFDKDIQDVIDTMLRLQEMVKEDSY